MPRIKKTIEVKSADRLTGDRADYTTDIRSYVDVDVQTERLAGVTFANSTTPIEAGSDNAYTSSWQSAGDYNKFIGAVYADQDVTIYLEQSHDGETVHVRSTQSYTGANLDGWFGVDIALPYCRVRVVADSDLSTFMVWARLSTGGD